MDKLRFVEMAIILGKGKEKKRKKRTVSSNMGEFSYSNGGCIAGRHEGPGLEHILRKSNFVVTNDDHKNDLKAHNYHYRKG